MIAKAISSASKLVATVERFILQLLIASIAIFVLTNVLFRMVGITIAWADELAVYTMVMSGFVGASLMLRARIDPAVLLLHELLPAKGAHVLRVLVSVVAVCFGMIMCYLSLLWFNPIELARSGFDPRVFEGATFNFIYTDKTPVMNVPTFFFYLVIPFFAVAITIHALANLMEDFGFITRPADPAGLNMGDNI